MTPDVPRLLMSVSKSVASAVAGILAGRGLLDVSARVEENVPELEGTSLQGASVQDLLDMRAGTRFDESYDNPGGRRAHVRAGVPVAAGRRARVSGSCTCSAGGPPPRIPAEGSLPQLLVGPRPGLAVLPRVGHQRPERVRTRTVADGGG